MPLDHFKTQVLLLHSEQSTLARLSAGFSDRYTVHCATSGSEALNTLVATPINVMISAQKLPGMSGLEALREAKKRSPETIGILLAGDGDEGIEALVGDEEVFQVVRGQVTGDSLLKLVDNATRQMRLMALAESANDTSASPEISTGEHIIMETSENGSTIISDGTGRMPALNPKKIGAAAAVGARSIDVLVLTKDQEFLATIRESSQGTHRVHYAGTLAQADEFIRKHKVGVAVVDAAMVGQKVEQLTQHLRKGSPRLVSIVAGRRDDGEMLMDLINRGKVYRFLLKPVSPGRARLAVEASVKHHLEAPDSAFKIGTPAAPAPSAKAAAPSKPAPPPAKPAPAAAKPAPAAPARPAAPAKPAAAPEARPVKPAPARTAQPAAPKPKAAPATPATAKSDPPLGSPIDDGLASAFDNESSLKETVTGLFGTVSKKIGSADAPTASASTPTGGGLASGRNKLVGIAVAAVVAVAAVGFWAMGGSDDSVPNNAEPEGRVSITEGSVDFGATPAGADATALLAEARLARDAGQVFNPLGSNAIELYLAALETDPANAVATAELDGVLTQALGMAETALLETRLDDADAALRRVELADPNNARLPFLKAQLAQVQLRGFLADARTAIRDTRFEDAANAIAAARALGVPDNAEIAVVAQELSNARSEQRADEVLALANARLEEGDLLRPANDNARYYFDLVLSNDPNNIAARQGLAVVASKLVLRARAEIDAGNLDEATAILKDARAIDPSSPDLVATAAALQSARDAVEAEARAAAEQRRIAEEQRAAEARAEAERLEAERLAAEAKAAEDARAAAAAATAAQRPAEVATATAKPAAGTTSGKPADTQAAASSGTAGRDSAAAPAVTATPPASAASAGTSARAEPAPTATASATEPAAQSTEDASPANIASLNRTRYVAPKYPRAAQRRGQSGWVDILFTVAVDGTVKDVEVRASEPGDVFADAAIRAVEKWEFEPVVEDGRVVEKRAGVRMMFALE